MRFTITLLAIFLCAMPAHAALSTKTTISSGTITSTQDLGTIPLDSPTRTIADYIKDYVDVPKGAIDWKVFSSTKEISVEGKTKEGYDYQYYKPGFSDAAKKLDGQIITVKGFMFPLNETQKQKLFLFGPFPVSCPFHYHVSPALVMEVHADKSPVRFSYDPVVMRGKLELVNKDPENSTFYKLVDAEEIK